MEDRPAITLNSWSPAPGADNDTYARYRKWRAEVYSPMVMKVPELIGNDSYQIVREGPEYPEMVHVNHYKSLADWRNTHANPMSIAVVNETRSWTERGIIEPFWSVTYGLIKSFRSKTAPSGGNEDTRVENASVMHMEAYRLSSEQQEKYVRWFNEYAPNIFVPLFMKSPGLVGYDWYEDTGLRRRQDTKEVEYSKYLSLVYFENINAYDSFMKSPEMIAFQKALRSVFPRGLTYKWYAQYQLVQSRRK